MNSKNYDDNKTPPSFFTHIATRPLLAVLVLLWLSITPGALFAADEFASLSPEQLKEFMALPYLQGYFPVPETTNVVRYDRSRASPGYNLYSSGHAAAAYLIDMKGHILHEWAYPLDDVWTDLPAGANAKGSPFWEDVYLLPDGSLLALYHDGGLIKIDKDSQLVWAVQDSVHHAIDVDDKGNIYVLYEEPLQLKPDVTILDQGILVFSPDGDRLRKTSFLLTMKNAQNDVVEFFLKNVIGVALAGVEDVFHANTLRILDGSLVERNPVLFRKGNILVCMLTISMVGIYNPDIDQFLWVMGPALWMHGQHDPHILDNGHMLIFDNHYQGSHEQSRVLEFDPLSKNIVWEYKPEGFYSDTHGAVQRLANGNTLIIETNTGRTFEVTPEGETVWEFFNPHATGPDDSLIAALFMLERIDPQSVAGWLKN